MEVKIVTMGSISSQTTLLVELPDLPNQVLQVWRLTFDIQSSSEATAIVHALSHDVNLGTTLSTADVAGQWAHVEQGRAVDSLANHLELPFWPEPYELIGTQRWDVLPSNGGITPFLTVHYTVRREPNLTKWTLLKARTSFERD